MILPDPRGSLETLRAHSTSPVGGSLLVLPVRDKVRGHCFRLTGLVVSCRDSLPSNSPQLGCHPLLTAHPQPPYPPSPNRGPPPFCLLTHVTHVVYWVGEPSTGPPRSGGCLGRDLRSTRRTIGKVVAGSELLVTLTNIVGPRALVCRRYVRLASPSSDPPPLTIVNYSTSSSVGPRNYVTRRREEQISKLTFGLGPLGLLPQGAVVATLLGHSLQKERSDAYTD